MALEETICFKIGNSAKYDKDFKLYDIKAFKNYES